MGKVPVIAIDGPSGSGKGTVAAALARHLGFHLLDSGTLYRALGLAALGAGLDLEAGDEVLGNGLARLAETLNLGAGCKAGDMGEAIRSEAAGLAASKVGAVPAARTALLMRQRQCRRRPGLVADGRDMGTVVFPDARLKLFLTATHEERARRRHKQLLEQGIDVTLSLLLRDLQARDARDRSRAVAPLRAATDAITVDTTGIDIPEVMEKVIGLAQQALQ